MLVLAPDQAPYASRGSRDSGNNDTIAEAMR